jgi:tRNA(Ile)-lysidine synthase
VDHPELFKLVVRRWLKSAGAPPIPHYRLDALREQTSRPGDDHNTAIDWDDCSLRWYRQRLWLLADGDIPPCPQKPWPPGIASLELGDGLGHLVIEGAGPDGLGARLAVSNRAAIKDARIIHGGHHRQLKNVFQEAAVPPWLRDSIPLLILGGELVAAGDWYLADSFAEQLSGTGARLRWLPENLLLKFLQLQQGFE